MVAPVFDGDVHRSLMDERTIHIRGMDEIHALVDGALDGGNGFLVVALAIELRHPHTSKSERAYLQLPKFSLLYKRQP
jgi:hypothetical protein